MPRCEYTETCPLFIAEVGYSPEFSEAMKRSFCLSDSSRCARLLAIAVVGRENVPAEMLPTDEELLEELKKSQG
jgi:hypothetical protein